ERVARQVLQKPKVAQLYRTVFVQENVARLDVAVHDLVFVEKAQPLGNLAEDCQGFVDRQGSALEPLLQVLAGNEFENQVRNTIRLAEIQRLDQMRMTQLADGGKLSFEALEARRIQRQEAVADLHRHELTGVLVARLVHGRHAAAADGLQNLQRSQCFR